MLVVEDEPKMANVIARGLRWQGVVVDVADSGEEMLELVQDDHPYDVILLDVMLPGLDGFESCARLRARRISTPILFLTARGDVDDRVAGLDGGGDDYVIKPFSIVELAARVRALARREPLGRPAELLVGDLRLDPAARRVFRGDVEIELSATELRLLEALMRRPGEVLTRYDLLEAAWDRAYENRSNVITVYIGYLRRKLDRPFGRADIETVPGGYRLRAET